MPVRVTTEPTSEPLTLASLKARLQIDHDDDDAVLQSLLVAARQKVESWEWRAHMSQTITLTLDRLPWVIYVPRPPLQSVTSITYIDDQGNQQTLAADQYDVDIYSEPGRITPAYGAIWPATRCQPNAVTIVYVAGHSDPCDVPQSSLMAIAMLVKQTYEGTRDCDGIKSMAGAPWGIDAMLNKAHDSRVLDFV